MSDRTSKMIIDGDKYLQERREKENKPSVPQYNYDTTVDKDAAVARSAEVPPEIISDNNNTLVQYALENKKTTSKTTQPQTVEVATIDTSAVTSQEEPNRGDNKANEKDEEKGEER